MSSEQYKTRNGHNMIPFLDLKLINAPYEIAFQNKLKSVLESGWFILGNEVKNLNLISQLIAKHCIELEMV
jgi:hypothetical protein